VCSFLILTAVHVPRALRVRSARRGDERARAAGSQGWAASSAAAPRGGAAAAASSRLEREGRTNFLRLRRGGRRRRLRLAADAIAVAVVLGGVGSGAAVVDCLSAASPPRTRAPSHARLHVVEPVRVAWSGPVERLRYERSDKLRIRRRVGAVELGADRRSRLVAEAAAVVSVVVRGCAGLHRGVAAWITTGAGLQFFNGAFAFVGDIAFVD